jgi:diaminohydroxyphosphoribosylaminopyrimidine deaminase / 5-amino-6-(5-phosphoribosylamino)uracil reductase
MNASLGSMAANRESTTERLVLIYIASLLLCWNLLLCNASLDNVTRKKIQRILDKIGGWQKEDNMEFSRPFVTLTFAQSLDGKIAFLENGISSSNLPLSGEESLIMTHALRSIHDAIIIGGQTLSADNPRLTNRLWGDRQPRPVVLDTNLKHIRKLEGIMKAQNIIVCCSEEASTSLALENLSSVEILPCRLNSDKSLDLHHVLEQLKNQYGIHTVMVEGGSSVLSSFVLEGCADYICVAITPKLIGNKNGLAAFSTMETTPWMNFQHNGEFLNLGSDCIYISRWKNTK